MALEQLAQGVLAWLQLPGAVGRANAGVVVDEDGLTMVDTLMVPSQWHDLGSAVDQLGRPVHRVVLTSIVFALAGLQVAMAARFWGGPFLVALNPGTAVRVHWMTPPGANWIQNRIRTRYGSMRHHRQRDRIRP